MILGKGFGFKTIYCILCASFMFEVLPQFEWITSLSDIPDKFINAISGGISAFGIAAIFMQGGSTGGTDIIAIVLSKYRDNSPGKIFMYCDLIIIGSIYFLPDKGLQDVIYGYIQMVSFSYMLDVLITGSKQSVQVFIFTKKVEEMADAIAFDMKRGVTVIPAKGWYSKEDREVLMVVTRKDDLNLLLRYVKTIDSDAFLSVSSVMGVYGQGFDTIKIKTKGSTRSKLEHKND